MSVTNCLFFQVLICSALFVALLSDLDIFVFTKDRFNVMFIIDLCLTILFFFLCCCCFFFFRNLFGTLLSLQPQIPSAGGQGESREEKVGST